LPTSRPAAAISTFPTNAWTWRAALSLESDIYPNYDIILCISTFSATAPLTAFAKQYGFRGATLHGLNEVILNSGWRSTTKRSAAMRKICAWR
jgi:hypothetical protein